MATGFCSVPSAFAADAPVVAGYSVLTSAKATDVDRGQLLLGELNCVACHKPADVAAASRPEGAAPDLSKAEAARLTPQYLTAYLSDPHGIKPEARRCPTSSTPRKRTPRPKRGRVHSHYYLVSLGGPLKASDTSGNDVIVEQGRQLYQTVGCVACHAPEKPFGEGDDLPSVPIGPQALKTTVDQLTDFLLDPLTIRPHGRMPSSNLG